MLHFYPDATVLSFFSDEVAKIASFNAEFRKSAGAADRVGKSLTHHALKLAPGAVLGAGALYLGNRALQNQRMGEAMRAQGGGGF
jgi:hypothetical protein